MTGGTRWVPAMRRALAEGVRAGEHGDVPIGAVVLGRDGAVLAAAGNEREVTGDPTAHAEVLALRRAAAVLAARGVPQDPRQPGEPAAADVRAWELSDCTLVVTLEPCAMCAGAIVNARVGRLVFGALDPKAGAVASLFDVVRDPRLNHRVEVVGGVLAQECAAPLREFFARHR